MQVTLSRLVHTAPASSLIIVLVFQISCQSCTRNQQARQRRESCFGSIFEAPWTHVWHFIPINHFAWEVFDLLVFVFTKLCSAQERDAIKALKIEELASQVWMAVLSQTELDCSLNAQLYLFCLHGCFPAHWRICCRCCLKFASPPALPKNDVRMKTFQLRELYRGMWNKFEGEEARVFRHFSSSTYICLETRGCIGGRVHREVHSWKEYCSAVSSCCS